MRYREFPIDEMLAPYVRQIWLLECEGPALFGGPERIVADGVVEAIFHYRRPFQMRFGGADAVAQPVSLLVSQISRYVEIQPAGAGGFVSVRFHPWGAHHPRVQGLRGHDAGRVRGQPARVGARRGVGVCAAEAGPTPQRRRQPVDSLQSRARPGAVP